jgi:hypothetical protein
MASVYSEAAAATTITTPSGSTPVVASPQEPDISFQTETSEVLQSESASAQKVSALVDDCEKKMDLINIDQIQDKVQTQQDPRISIINGSHGPYYVLNGLAYDARFPVDWVLSELPDTGYSNCGNCMTYGTYRGVFVGYCANCAEDYEHQRGCGFYASVCDDAIDLTLATNPFNTYLKDVKVSEIGDDNLHKNPIFPDPEIAFTPDGRKSHYYYKGLCDLFSPTMSLVDIKRYVTCIQNKIFSTCLISNENGKKVFWTHLIDYDTITNEYKCSNRVIESEVVEEDEVDEKEVIALIE